MVLGVLEVAGLADDVEHRVVVLPAGGYPVHDDIRDRQVRRGERRLRFDLVGLSGFDLLGEFLRARSSGGRSSGDAPPTLLLAAFCSARNESAVEITARRAASAVSRASTSAGSSPRLSCERRTASGFSRSSFRSITAARLLLTPSQGGGRGPSTRDEAIPQADNCNIGHAAPPTLSEWSGCWTRPSRTPSIPATRPAPRTGRRNSRCPGLGGPGALEPAQRRPWERRRPTRRSWRRRERCSGANRWWVVVGDLYRFRFSIGRAGDGQRVVCASFSAPCETPTPLNST